MTAPPEQFLAALPDRLRAARQARGLSRAELARAGRINTSTVHHLEHGEVTPRLDTAIGIALALGTGLDALIGLPDHRPLIGPLPDFADYLRRRYPHLPASTRRELTAHFARLAAAHQPRPGEFDQL